MLLTRVEATDTDSDFSWKREEGREGGREGKKVRGQSPC